MKPKAISRDDLNTHIKKLYSENALKWQGLIVIIIIIKKKITESIRNYNATGELFSMIKV